MIGDEILSKVTTIKEDEEDCEDTDEIEDLIQPLTKYEVMQALEVLKHAPFVMPMLEMRCVPKWTHFRSYMTFQWPKSKDKRL